MSHLSPLPKGSDYCKHFLESQLIFTQRLEVNTRCGLLQFPKPLVIPPHHLSLTLAGYHRGLTIATSKMLLSVVSLLGLLWQDTTNWVLYTTEMHYLIVLEVRKPKSRCWQDWFLWGVWNNELFQASPLGL